MKRKDRKLLFRVVNALSSIVLVVSCVYLLFWGLSAAAITTAVVSVCCIGGPVVMSGESTLEIILGIFEALFHAVIDATIGIVEAIGNALSSIG